MAAAKFSDDLDYETWAPKTKATLTDQGLWDVVENGVPPDPSKIPELAATIQPQDLSKWRDLVVKDTRALQVMQSSLPKSAFKKTLCASSAKDVWDMLKGNQGTKLSRLEKEFQELSMVEGETLELYLDRVRKVLEELRRLNCEKSKYEVNKKVLSSLAMPYRVVASILEENMEVMEKMPLESLVEFFDIYDSAAEEFSLLMLNDMCLNSKPDKWCGVCNKNNHYEEECYFNSRAGSSSGGARRGKPRKGECFQCGERGHYARDCKRKNQQEQVAKEAKEEEIGVDYLLLAEDVSGRFSYDEDMWMIYANGTTDHMTPYEKYFTALDKTHKAKVGLADGTYLRVEGRGDVKIMMKEGKKKTIKNVLFVPELNRNVLSIDLMLARGYSAIMKSNKRIFLDRTGAVFGDTVWDERGPALRLNVIEGKLTS